MRFRLIIILIFTVLLAGCSYSFFERPSSYPPNTVTGDFPDYDHFTDPTEYEKKPFSEILKEGVDLLDSVFLVQGLGDYKCIDPNTFQKFITMFFKAENNETIHLDNLCLFKKDHSYEERLRWVLSGIPGNVWTILPPTTLIDADLSALKSMDLLVDSSLDITVEEGSSTFKLNGVKFNLNKSILQGTSFSWIPEFLLRFDVDKIEINDDGNYYVKLNTPIGYPIALKGILQSYVFNKKPLIILNKPIYFKF
jgi:hypothetical protein